MIKDYLMNNREVIRDFHGKIIGTITVDNVGNKTVRDFYGKILGKYDKKANVTRDFYGKVLAKGDQSTALLPIRR